MKRTILLLAMSLTAGAMAQSDLVVTRQAVNDAIVANPRVSRMSSDLILARQAIVNGSSVEDALQAYTAGAIRGDQLQVIIGTSDIDATVSAVEVAGMTVVGTFDDYGCRTVTVRCDDPTQLDGILADSSTVQVVAEPLAMVRSGSVAAQADPALNAAVARTTHSTTGAGVRVGVMSDSFIDNRLGGGSVVGGFLTGSTDQVSGDLPASIRMIDPGPGGRTDEGNAMAQLVYDAAPGCEIAFASASSGYFTFATNITALHTDGLAPSDIIVDDVGYFASPMYQDGPIALAYEGAFSAGVPCFSSAGNNADNAHESAYSDINPGTDDLAAIPSGDDLHDFGGGDTHLAFSSSPGEVITVTLHWNEPYAGTLGAGAGSEADLDLYVVNSVTVPIVAGVVVASSVALQGTGGSPAGEPYEVVQYTSPGGTQYVVIEHYDGVDPSRVHVDINGGTVIDTGLIGARTIWGHTAAANVQAVAAAPWYDIEDAGAWSPDFFNVDVESFTSLGGALPFDFDGSGNPIATVTRNKPDITAPDGVNTTFFGQALNLSGAHSEPDGIPNFFGTSAAAPNAAAVAALMLSNAQNNWSLSPTPTEIYSALQSTAIDINTTLSDYTGPGYDYRTGHGYIDANLANGVSGIPVELSVFSVD